MQPKPLLVLKIGTSALTRPDGSLNQPQLVEVARQIHQLHPHYRLVIVSSGAVGTGRRYLPGFDGSITDRKAAAAIGNPILINTYARFLSPYDIHIAQSLCERRHFSDRDQFLQLRETFERLWSSGLIPIANENDVVSSLELKFSDNDELATLIAIGFGAEALLLATSVPGVLDEAGQLVPRIEQFDQGVMGLARAETSAAGLGGMVSKLTFARLATRLGIKVIIFGLREPESILRAAREETGTLCLPQPSSQPARRKWLASGSLVTGRLEVDAGAAKALSRRKSLLAVGITRLSGDFDAGEVIELVRPGEATPFALGRARLSAHTLQTRMGDHDVVVAHADDIVLL